MAMFWKISVVVTLALCLQVFAQNKKKNLLGGWREGDVNDEYAMRALLHAKEEYNKDGKDGYITEIIRIIRLRKQVVAGMRYWMEVEAVLSPCNPEECQIEETTKKRCTFKIVDIPWQNEKKVEIAYCNANMN